MPIIGLTDAASVVPQFPRIGKLRKGGEAVEKVNAKGETYKTYGPDLEYFRFTEERPGVAAAFTAAFGPQPAELRVFLPYPTTEENFPTWAEKWSASGLLARGDGQTIRQWRTPEGKYSFEPIPMPPDWQESKEWRGVGRLSVIIPELVRAGFVGYVSLETGSKWDMIALTQALLKAQLESELHGHTLQGIEFILRRQWIEVATPRPNGQRAMVKKSLVRIEPAPTWVALQMAMSERLALTPGGAQLQLADGRTVDGVTGEILGEEPPHFEDDGGVEEGNFRPFGPEHTTPVVPPTPTPPAKAPAKAPAKTSQTAAVTLKLGADGLPLCPVCNGKMWDNRDTAARPKANKRAPDFKCRAAKETGCEGVVWPGQFVPQAAGGGRIGKEQITELEALIKSVYGTDPAELAKAKVHMLNAYGVDDRALLTADQGEAFAAVLIDMLNKLSGGAEQASFLSPAETPATSPYDEEKIPF